GPVAPHLPEKLLLREDPVRLRRELTTRSNSFAERSTGTSRTRTRRVGRSMTRSPATRISPAAGELRLINARMRASSSSEENGRPTTSSAPRSSARTRSTGSAEGARTMTGTFRSHVRPGSPRRKRRQRSSSARSTTSGRALSTSSSASERRAAPSTSNPSSRRCRPRYSRVSGSGSATRTALGLRTKLVRSVPARQMSFVAELRQAILRRQGRELQPSVPEDAPDQPEPEYARDDEADEGDQVDTQRVRTALREDADHCRAEQASEDHDCDGYPVGRLVDAVVDLVDHRVLDVHLERALAQLLEHVAHLVWHVPCDRGESQSLDTSSLRERPRMEALGEEPPRVRLRDLEDVEVRIDLLAHRSEGRDGLVEDHESARQLQVHRVDELE